MASLSSDLSMQPLLLLESHNMMMKCSSWPRIQGTRFAGARLFGAKVTRFSGAKSVPGSAEGVGALGLPARLLPLGDACQAGGSHQEGPVCLFTLLRKHLLFVGTTTYLRSFMV